MDLFSDLWSAYRRTSEALPTPLFDFLVNAFAVLLIPAVMGFLCFLRGWRGPMVLWLVVLSGVLLALALPLENLLAPRSLRPWVLPFLLLGMLYLPRAWAFLAEPRRALQQQLARHFQLGLLVLFLLNLFWMVLR